MKRILFSVILCGVCVCLLFAVTQLLNKKSKAMKKKILFVVTSHSVKGSTGQPTGYYLGEVSHPWEVLFDEGYEIDFVSPLGGKPPVDGFNLDDPTNRKFWKNELYREKINHSLEPGEVVPESYCGVFYAGGHGAMWDLAGNKGLAEIAAAVYENGGVIGAVCHGPAGLINIKLTSGVYLIAGKNVNAFTNEEEAAVGLTGVVPFLLEDALKERGAIFEKSGLWQSHVTVDQRVVTGQNPQSAKGVGEAMLKELSRIP